MSFDGDGFTGSDGGGGGGAGTITAGTGLTGGGDIGTNPSLALSAGSIADLAAGAGLAGKEASVQNITATGTDQAGAAAITGASRHVSITGGAANNGVRLPATPAAGDTYYVNVTDAVLSNPNSGTFVNVYPGSGGKFRHRNANVALTLSAFHGVLVRCTIGGATPTWEAAMMWPYYTGFNELAISLPTNWYGLNTYVGRIDSYGNIQMFNGSSILFAQAATNVNKIAVPDNIADAFSIQETGNKFITICTTDNAEGVIIPKALWGQLAKQQQQTLDYTFSGDSGKIIEILSATGKNLTLPATAAVGTQCDIVQTGDGQITVISTGSGTVVNASSQFKTRAKWSRCTAYVQANVGGSAAVWVLSGDTAA